MSLFDRYIAVDWSASNTPKTGKDSIWIAEVARVGTSISLVECRNPRTRIDAMDFVTDRLRFARAAGGRAIVGFDFPFGYPNHAARLIAGAPDWRRLWSVIFDRIEDDNHNRTNRFEVAATINIGLRPVGPLYWGHPTGRIYEGLMPTRLGLDYAAIGEMRLVEQAARAKSVWQLNGSGSVGGQALTGIAQLERLRRSPEFGSEIAIWPFETDFERNLNRRIVVAEIYPSIFAYDRLSTPADRAQVEAIAFAFARLDDCDHLGALLSAPDDLSLEQRQIVVREEGWIVGVGHDALRHSLTEPKRVPEPALSPATPIGAYLRDPEAIYAQSFSAIRAEADLSSIPPALEAVVVRMIHASGMTDIIEDIRWDGDVVGAAAAALRANAPVFCDCEAVRAGLSRRFLPASAELVMMLNDPAVPEQAQRLGTTRSAAAVELWRERLAGAIVVIGNAPTALHHLLDLLEAGVDRPAAIIATPVGFVGASESKARLALDRHGVPFLTLLGRRGGSAMASAALNAIAGRMSW